MAQSPADPASSATSAVAVSATAVAVLRRWESMLVIGLLVWVWLALCYPLYDTDFWFHLRTGDWILANGRVPQTDLYTFSDADKPWIDLHWGFQVLVAALFRLGGVPLVTLVKATLLTLTVAIGWRAGGSGLPAWQKCLVWLLPCVCVIGRGLERPEMLSQLFLTLWLLIAARADRQPRWMWWLPVLNVVWINCHALFILGLSVGAAYAVDLFLRQRWGGRLGLAPVSGRPALSQVGIVGGLVAVSSLLNPYGWTGAMFPLTLYRKFSVEKEFYSRTIGEFQPPIMFVLRHGFGNLFLLAELGTWVISAASFVVLFRQTRRWSPYRVLLFAAYTHLAWQASRNTNIFALVTAVIACDNFAEAFGVWRAKATVNLRSAAVAPSVALDSLSNVAMPPSAADLPRTRWLCVGTIGLILAVVSGAWNAIGEGNKPFAIGEAPRWFMHDAAQFAAQPGFPERAFVANIGQAEVYVYHNAPERRVFMDARLEVCTQQTFERFNAILEGMARNERSWLAQFSGQELPVVLLDSRTARGPINGLLQSRDWRLVFADASGAVFLPTSRAEALQLPAVDPRPLMFPDGPPAR